ncbi:MAG TPA: PKD domain-containing protein, partial [Flavitalea sp.]|nr:PKD domain-containing protein [Flavitalea sp.]
MAAAQAPVAAFSASVVKGCAPLVVQFTDQSAGDPTGWTWDFGNGQLVRGQNQTITYTLPGQYSVTLVVRNAAGINSITKSDFIVVASPPVVDFSVSQSLSCLNVPLQFTSVSATPGQSLTGWNWDFGDGSTSSEPDPKHSYSSSGAFTVKLTAATAGGCTSTVSRQNTVQVSGGVTAAFDFTIPATCKPPFAVKFQNQSQGSGNLNYSWTSSVGSVTAVSPEISFPATGEYSVKLVSMDNYGCSDTITKTVVLREINTEFSVSPSCIGLPSTFTNISGEPPLSSIWQLDNETHFDRNLTYTFSSPGTHRVKLVNTYVGCQDSAVRTIRVANNPQVKISMDRRVSCRIPATIHFRDNTAGATQWVWNFGDGTSSTARFPAKTYTAAGEYRVSLTVTNSDGCTTSYIHPDPVILKAPSATIVNAPGELCEGRIFSPVAEVLSIEKITRYLWNFGDGSTSTRSKPSHKYVSSGNYPLSLSIFTASGCTSTTRGEVNVGTPVVVDINASSLQVCPLQPVSFNAAGNDPAINYSWDFGNNNVVSGNEVVHNFTDTGRIRVVLTGRNNGCAVKAVKQIIVNPPIARFRASVDCNGSKAVSFVNESIPDTSGEMHYTWDFGDPAIAPSNLYSPQIIFPRPGTYQVTLTASSPNTACTTTVTNSVTISGETVKLSASKSAVCRGEVFELTAEEGYGANSFNRYQWTIGDQSFNSDSKTIKVWVDRNGKFPISLRITDVNGCIRDSTSDKMITVRGPVAAFNSPALQCGDSATRFTNLSTIESAVARYTWNFGDGHVESYATSGITHRYENEGAYMASLVVTDQSQCSDSTQSEVVVSRPRAAFSNVDSTWCPGVPINFTDQSSGNISHWNWTFGDGGTSELQHAEYRYGPNDGNYTVSLKVTNDLGC